MNKLIIVFLILLGCSACAQREDGYVVNGKIPGLQDGIIVSLRNAESDEREVLARDTVRNGRFELRGKVASPLLCELTVSNRPLVKERKNANTQKAWVFLDNSHLTLAAPCFDSIGYVNMNMTFDSERVGAVTGSPLQEQFNAYRRALLPVELAAAIPDDSLSSIRFKKHEYAPAEYARLYAELWPQCQQGRAAVKTARMEYIRQHNDSPVALFVAERLLKESEDFTLTGGELDALEIAVANIADSIRTPRFRQSLHRARTLAYGTPYTDLEVETQDGKTVTLSQFVTLKRPLLIDFWASWCGPCRAALPQVKELRRKYAGRLDILSIAVSDKAADWKKAIRQEQLTEWPQVRVTAEKSNKEVFRAYNVTTIPRFILIDPQGRTVLSTNSPKVVEMTITKE